MERIQKFPLMFLLNGSPVFLLPATPLPALTEEWGAVFECCLKHTQKTQIWGQGEQLSSDTRRGGQGSQECSVCVVGETSLAAGKGDTGPASRALSTWYTSPCRHYSEGNGVRETLAVASCEVESRKQQVFISFR
jgi:hypothetical protein